MQELIQFENELATLIGAPSDLRPFVCDGSPLACEVFIVGFNPATSVSADFWKFWRAGEGFDKEAWFEAYKTDREIRPLGPGKTRRNSVSPSRRVLELILKGASPIRCLETNIYAAATEQAVDLASERRITAPFDYLLKTVRPRIIVAHGVHAQEHIRKIGVDARVIPVGHFSRGWSHEAALKFGSQIKMELNKFR